MWIADASRRHVVVAAFALAGTAYDVIANWRPAADRGAEIDAFATVRVVAEPATAVPAPHKYNPYDLYPAALLAVRSGLDKCLRRVRGVGEDINLGLDIGPSGDVQRVRLHRASDGLEPDAQHCIERVVRRVRFHQTDGPVSVNVWLGATLQLRSMRRLLTPPARSEPSMSCGGVVL